MNPTTPANPIEILYSWQTLLLAIVIVGLTQSFKATLEAVLVFRTKGTDSQSKTGQELRKEMRGVNGALLPLFPIVTGALIGAFVPLHPEALVQYVTQHAPGTHLGYALWGAATGQFADYLYAKMKDMLPKSPTPATSATSSGRGGSPVTPGSTVLAVPVTDPPADKPADPPAVPVAGDKPADPPAP